MVVVKGKEYLEDRFLSLPVYEETVSIVCHFATDKKTPVVIVLRCATVSSRPHSFTGVT
jgi:hypothetical protein